MTTAILAGLFIVIVVPTAATAIEVMKCRKLHERTNALLEQIAKKP